MKQVFCNGKPLTSLQEIGAGQEAVVYAIGGGLVAKLYRQPNDPYYAGSSSEQQAAKIRLSLIRQKLSAFPSGLPANVIGPKALLTDSQGEIVGYVMSFIKAETLLTYGDLQFRESKNISNNEIRDIFIHLHQTLKAVHQHGVVIGDFNDMNILVKGNEAYWIDTDSWQFEGFLSTMYTEKFVDPLLCGLQNGIWTMTKPHNPFGDWYAFNALLFKTLLFVDPYGGVYKPNDTSKRVKQQLRPKNRITVFHPEVIYPKHAYDYKVLPEKLMQHFEEVFIHDRRGEFPLQLLSSMHWQTCPKCGIQHARMHCPICSVGIIIPIAVSSGNIQVHEVFKTVGVIMSVAFHNGKLCYLYHENGEYKRETSEIICTGELDRELHFALQGSATVFAKATTVQYCKNGTMSKLSVDCVGNVPIFSTTENDLFWVVNGVIQHANPLGLEYTPTKVGEGIADQTLIWSGASFGFGMYKAGHILQGFIFEKGRRVINDSLQLPFIKGEIIDAKCYLSETRAWLLLSTKYQAKYINHCIILNAQGKVLLDITNEQGDTSWLDQIKGKSAVGGFLFCPSNDGVIRLSIDASGNLETKVFSDTASYVNQYSQLIVSPQGIYVVSKQKINLISIK
ncbi:MAG: hypothetical protein LBP53_08975 [Candidatus Peribacteria bacterium]|jgi:H/ACA ribonucleoprotein complex subunit 3|nr:hypothetical protein [Candidatus Peribacteria bacterium]